MVHGVAHALASAAAAIVLVACSGFAAGRAGAEEQPAGPDSPSVLERSLSPECRAPGTKLYTLAPLKTVRAALREQRPVKVLTIGSSSSYGMGASSPVATYPTRLEGELESQFPRVDIEVVNRGLPGEVEESAAERIKLEVAEAQPDLVVWQVGTSDALAHVDLDSFKEILGRTLDWLRENKFDVVVVDPQFTPGLAQNDYYLEIVKAIEETARSHRVPLVRRFEAMRVLAQAAPKQRYPLLDQFPMNDMGYRCLAEHVAHAIALGILAAEAETPEPQAK